MTIFYHGTRPSLIPQIMKQGLDPQKMGTGWEGSPETRNKPAISLSTTKEHAQAYMNLGALEDSKNFLQKLKAMAGIGVPHPLIINFPKNKMPEKIWGVGKNKAFDEWHYDQKIPASWIKTSAFTSDSIAKVAMITRGQWHRAKAHVAKGHEEEKERLQSRGRLAGALAGLGVATPEIVQALRRKKLPHYLPLLAPVIGAGIGHLGGSHVALKRLELSQKRGYSGHYAPLRKEALSPITLPMTSTARRVRITAPKQPLAAPVVHKPQVVKTPMPAPPVVEPTTRTPTMMPKTSAYVAGVKTAMMKCAYKSWQGSQGWVEHVRLKKSDIRAIAKRHGLPENEVRDMLGPGAESLKEADRITGEWAVKMGKGSGAWAAKKIKTAGMKFVRKDTKKRAAVDDMGEPALGWRGTPPEKRPRGNEPEPESWRGHDF